MAADLTPCVFCGTPRPLDVPRCPTCKRGWIDSHVVTPTPTGTDDAADATEASAAIPVAAAAEPTVPEAPAEPPPPEQEDDQASPEEPAMADPDATEVPAPPAAAAATAAAVAATVPEAPAEPPPPEQEDDQASPEEPAMADPDATEVPAPPAAAAATAAAVAATVPEAPAEPPPPEREDDQASPGEPAIVDPDAAEPTVPEAPGEPPPAEHEDEDDQATPGEPTTVDPDAAGVEAPPAAVVAAAAAAATRPSSRPGDVGPPNERPGDRPPNDRPTSGRPVSPTPPTHPIDDASLHLDSAVDEPPPAPRRGRTGQRLLIAGVVAVLIAGWFGALTLITRDDPAEVAGTTTTPAVNTSQALVAGPSTTIPEPTTTTPEPTTTIDPTLLTGPFPEVGNPVDISDLRLGAFAVSPIDFGDPDGLGRLVATLGQPASANTVDDGDFGLCPGEPGFTATWGPFTVLFTGTPENGALAGYRLDNEPAAHPTAGLSTLSELSLGDTIEHLESVYPEFDISYEEIDGSLHFILVRSDGVTLLWGPVSSSEPDGTVLGIYSPAPCDGGPIPSG